MKLRMAALGFFGVLLCLPVFAVVERRPVERDHREREAPPATARSVALDLDATSPAAASARSFVAAHGGEWSFRVDPRTGRLSMASGSGIPLLPGQGNRLRHGEQKSLRLADGEWDVTALEPAVRAFLDGVQPFVVPAQGELELDRASSVSRDGGRLVSFNYDWLIDGIPVEGARVFVRVNSGNVTQFGSHLVGPLELATMPAIEASEAIRGLLAYSGDAETARMQGRPELVIQSEEGGANRIEFRLVWKIRYTQFGEVETWGGRVDAITGEVVGYGDVNHYARVLGGIYPSSPFDGGEVEVPFPLADVTAGSSTTTTNSAGYAPQSAAQVSSNLSGRYFDIICNGCSNPASPLAQATVGAGRLDFGLGGTNEVGNGRSTPAGRTTFYHLNQVRLIARKWLAGVPWLSTIHFTATVNINSECNAFYDGVSVNFFRSGGGCNNTGEIADVVRHEWGHGLDQNTLGGDGGTGEGTADVVAMHLSHSPQVGPGFRIDGTPVRHLDKDVSSLGLLTASRIDAGDCNILPDDGLSVHCVGQVFGQTAWDLAGLLVQKHGYHTGWRESERLFFTSLPDAGTYDPISSLSIYNAYLLADDDDGNLANGTPNGAEIYQAFNLHEIDTGPVGGSPGCARPAQPEVTVTNSCDEFELTWNPVEGAALYRVLRSIITDDTAFMPVDDVPPSLPRFVDDEVVPGTDYWYAVMAIAADGCESTIENPTPARLGDFPLLELTVALPDDTPMGNRSGSADPGEQVDFVLTLTNHGESEASQISGRVVPLSAGVTMMTDSSSWPPIPAGGSAVNLDTLRMTVSGLQVPCGSLLHFVMLPTDGSACSPDASFFDVQVGEPNGTGGFVCDDTPACFLEPDFDGLAAAVPGSSCGETELSWQPAASNCTNATIGYNVYRSTDPTFVPGPGDLVAAGVQSTAYSDMLLDPDLTYHYVVRADDSRSGEDDNSVVRSVISPSLPDVRPPLFGGLESASPGGGCAETVLSWSAGLESCNGPVAYAVYRSTEPMFTPGPENLVASTLSTSFVDVAPQPGADFNYVVRARDDAGNEDLNDLRLTVPAHVLDRTLSETAFETGPAGWSLWVPNDAVEGWWEWGDPTGTQYQPETDATTDGVNCWITGLATGDSNGDVDGGTTTLLSAAYDIQGAVQPSVGYSRWFTNDRGASPGDTTDTLRVEVSDDDGETWASLETVGAGTPLAWVPVEHALEGLIDPTSQVRFRFSTADLGDGSLVEAGIDDFRLIDVGQGCNGCAVPVEIVETIQIDRNGGDVVLDWSGDPASGTRFAIYKLGGSGFGEALRVGTTEMRSFVHEGAALSAEDFYYRVTVIDACGNESD